MKNLQMSLILFWFNITKKLIKKEDYRSITPYWCSRLILVDGVKKSQKWWRRWLDKMGEEYFYKVFQNELPYCGYDFVSFDTNTMTLGYPKSGDTERILKLEHKGIEIRTGNIEWGAELGKLYFVIKHGNIINE